MIKKNDYKKIEEIVDLFGVTMKKGFMSSLILLVLEKESCHGYKILKEIEQRTFGVWAPTSSTIYPLLDSLKKKTLIKCIESDDIGRQKKVYKITPKGKETLKMLLQKTQMMMESMRSIILSTIGITDVSNDSLTEVIEKIITIPQLNLIDDCSFETKIEMLKYNREMTKHRIKIMNNNLEMIEKMLSKLEGEVENDAIEQDTRYITNH